MITVTHLKNLCRSTQRYFAIESDTSIFGDEVMRQIKIELDKNKANNPTKSRRWCILKTHTKLNGDKL